jgi:MFS family permease
MAMQTVVSRWFPTKKGVVMGWATLGLGASTTLMLPFFNWLLGSIGIVKAYWVMALIAAIVCIYNYIVVRDVPEELGIAPDNNPNIDTAALTSEAEQIHEYMKSSPWTIKKLLKTKELWLTAYMLGCGMLVATGIFSQFVPRMASYGVDANLAVLMLSLVCIFGVPFSYMWGVLDAKFGPKNLTTIMLCWYLVGVIVLIVSGGNIVGSAIGLCIFESALGGINNMLTSYTTTVWGRYDFQNANRLMYPIYNAVRASAFIIMAMSTALFGGNYNITYGIMAGLLVIAIICSIIMKDTLIGRSDADMKAALNIKD